MPELLIEFDRATQGLGALREAAYRLIGEASCKIEEVDKHYICHLIPKSDKAAKRDNSSLRNHFLDLVTDENLREKIAADTTPVRNLILALAFGSLVKDGEKGIG